MSKTKTAAELRLLEPRYTIGGLFESGTLGNADEEALNEIRDIRLGFLALVNPTRGWMSPRTGGVRGVPRSLANSHAWRRYTDWRRRWSKRIVAPSPSVPWGLTQADIVVWLITEPQTFNDLAPVVGTSAWRLVELFVRSVRDYGRYQPAGQPRDLTPLWEGAKVYRSAHIPTANRRKQTRERVRRLRERRKANA